MMPTVVVASLGRSGSSMLTRACALSRLRLEDSPTARKQARQIVQNAWSLDAVRFEPGFVYKTHDYPAKCTPPPAFVRFIYTFADPFDVVTSLCRQREAKGLSWMQKHAEHMKVDVTDFDRLFLDDIFDLERHYDAWIGCTTLPIVAIRYEALWQHRGLLSEFLGFELMLPTFQPRTSSVTHSPDRSDAAAAERTYGGLQQKILSSSLHVSPPAMAVLRRCTHGASVGV
jgi:hypothetical protein